MAKCMERYQHQQSVPAISLPTSQLDVVASLPTTDPNCRIVVSLPYLGWFSQALRRKAAKFGITLVSRTKTTLLASISQPKTPLLESQQSDVIYCINCSCDKVYIGQTGREIQSRTKEHFEQWKRNQGAFRDHCSPGHNPKFEDVTIMASESSLEIRECKEAMLIAKAGQAAISNDNIGMRSAVNRSRGKIFENQWLTI